MKRILLKGPIFTSTGYGNHTRQIYEFLMTTDLKIDVLPTNWGIYKSNYNEDNELFSSIKNNLVKSARKNYDISFQVLTPDEWDCNLAKKNIGVTAAIEATYCIESWLKQINKMNSVIVTSQHAKNSILNGFSKFKKKIKTDIHVVGLYATNLFYESKHVNQIKELESFKTDNVYLTVGQMTDIDFNNDRKNIINTINSLNKYYHKNNQHCTLILKTNIMTNSFRIKENFKTFLNDNIYQKFKNINLILITGEMSEKELYSIYKNKSITAFILLTKGECFCIPTLEAALSKIPIVATNWSAHKEYLGEDFYKVDYTLKKCGKVNKYFHENSLWAQYCEKSFFNQLDMLKENVKDTSKLQKRLINEVNKYNMFKMYKKVLNSL